MPLKTHPLSRITLGYYHYMSPLISTLLVRPGTDYHPDSPRLPSKHCAPTERVISARNPSAVQLLEQGRGGGISSFLAYRAYTTKHTISRQSYNPLHHLKTIQKHCVGQTHSGTDSRTTSTNLLGPNSTQT